MPMTVASDDINIAAKLFRGLGEPTRLAILLELRAGERRVKDLVEAVGTSQGNVSGHLACLKACGLVLDRPEARQVFYRIASDETIDLFKSAERLLASTGTKIDICPNYSRARQRQ